MSNLQLRNPFVLFDSVFQDLFDPSNSALVNHLNSQNMYPSFPVFDQYIDENESQVIEFALAGYSVDDLNVEIEGSYVTVSANKSDENKKDKQVRRIARRSFKEKILVRDKYDVSKLDASFKDGILKLVIPLNDSKRLESRKVKIKQ